MNSMSATRNIMLPSHSNIRITTFVSFKDLLECR
jgi:hypothetical protein